MLSTNQFTVGISTSGRRPTNEAMSISGIPGDLENVMQINGRTKKYAYISSKNTLGYGVWGVKAPPFFSGIRKSKW